MAHKNPKKDFNASKITPTQELQRFLENLQRNIELFFAQGNTEHLFIEVPRFEYKGMGRALFNFKKHLNEKYGDIDFTMEPVTEPNGDVILMTLTKGKQNTLSLLADHNIHPQSWVEHFRGLNQVLGDDDFAKWVKQKNKNGKRALKQLRASEKAISKVEKTLTKHTPKNNGPK